MDGWTVQELIDELSKVKDKSVKVIFRDYEEGWMHVQRIDEEQIRDNQNVIELIGY